METFPAFPGGAARIVWVSLPDGDSLPHQASLGMWIAFPQISPSCGLEELRFLGAKVPRNRRIKDAFEWFAR